MKYLVHWISASATKFGVIRFIGALRLLELRGRSALSQGLLQRTNMEYWRTVHSKWYLPQYLKAEMNFHAPNAVINE